MMFGIDFAAEAVAFLQVVLIDLVLAGDNAIVVGMAAAAVPLAQRRKVILLGIAAAVVMRILFAVVTTKLMAVVGLTLAGGVLLLWVCWKMWRDLREGHEEEEGAAEVEHAVDGDAKTLGGGKTVAQAVCQVALADLSMSLDNVLAVAGAAGDHMWVLIAGLLLSVILMGAAASVIARLLVKHRWIGYVGLAMIVYVALSMIYRGGNEVISVAGLS